MVYLYAYNPQEVELQEAAFYGLSRKVRSRLQQEVVDINCVSMVIHSKQ